MSPYKVSVIVVSYNTREKLRRCLRLIEPEHEVIVVDNASVDGSAEMVAVDSPTVRLIRNSENRGFGAANNQGMEVASGDLFLLLNSDCYAQPGAISELAQSFAVDRVVAAGGKLLNPDESLQESVAGRLTLWAVFSEQTLLEKTHLTASYWQTRRVLTGAGLSESPLLKPCDQVMGACLMMRPLERFDERYFLYCEDTDLCARLAHHGTIVYNPGAVFTHELGSSSSGIGRWRSVARYNRGKELYFEIHQGRVAMVVCWLFDRLGASLRLVIWSVPTLFTLGLSKRFRTQVGLFWKVLTAPLQGPDHAPHIRR
ncbi:MAG: glycosyltransferase family 2 protein [Armatimonadetes bacterium]|nr:glycosyltransferase family 2 protein [Armatimonadota bacterium]